MSCLIPVHILYEDVQRQKIEIQNLKLAQIELQKLLLDFKEKDLRKKGVDCCLPVGYRFHPTDEELINHYLRRHILGGEEDPCIIPEICLLYKIDPWDLPRLFKERSIVKPKEAEWWFISRLLSKTKNSRKFDRQTLSGHWKITGQKKKINAKGTNKLIGTMRNLVFIKNNGSSTEETVWVMHEYRLSDCNIGANFFDQQKFVLCHLINKRDEFINASTSVEAGSMSSFINLDSDVARNNIPESVTEAIMDPNAEALCPAVNLNLSSNQRPCDIHIANDNQFDWLEKDGSIDEWLDAIINYDVNEICQQGSVTEPGTDNGQGWPRPVERPIDQREHMPSGETSVRAQDNSLQRNFGSIFCFEPVDYCPEINCLTLDPTPTRASRIRDTVQLRKEHFGGTGSKGKVTGLVKDYREINCLTRDPVTMQASRGRDRVHLQNKPSARLVSKVKDREREAGMDKAAVEIFKNVFSMRELKACLERPHEIETSHKSESSDFTSDSAIRRVFQLSLQNATMVRDKGLQGSVPRKISNRSKHLESKSFQTEAKQNQKVTPSSKAR